MLRKILQHSRMTHYSNSSRLRVHMRYVSHVPIKPFHISNSNFQLVPRICNYTFHQFKFQYSNVANRNDIQSLVEIILSENEDLKNSTVEDLNNILSFLLSGGYTTKEIKEKFSPYIKNLDYSSFIIKFNQLSDIGSDIFSLLPLLSLDPIILTSVARRARKDKIEIKDFPNRIAYLCHHLELDPNELILKFMEHARILIMEFKLLDRKMNILKNANISSEYIVEDLWLFYADDMLFLSIGIAGALASGKVLQPRAIRCSRKHVKSLACILQAAKLGDMELKPWMLRYLEEHVESTLMSYPETYHILDGDRVVDNLVKKLNCRTECINNTMERIKPMKTVNVPKIEQIIDFLLDKDYTSQDIINFPRVLCSSVQTLSRRFEEYQLTESTLPALPQLYMSSKRFERKSRLSLT